MWLLGNLLESWRGSRELGGGLFGKGKGGDGQGG